VYEAPGRAAVRAVDLPAMGPGMVEVETRFSALSRGTERLVFRGAVPESEWRRMRAPHQVGDFPFPVRHGYAAVGRVVAGAPDLIGRDVFCLHPHQTRFRVPEAAVVPVPEGVDPARAVLAANMETALNGLWDADLTPGARVLVVGAGLVGRLIADLLLRRGDLTVTVTDIRPDPGIMFDDECVKLLSSDETPSESFDVAFHASASAGGLATALDALAFEGRVIELSWYGDRAPEVPLGGAFHANRLSIVSSQASHVARTRRASTSRRERLAAALDLLAPARLDRLVTGEIAFADLPAALPDLLAEAAPGIATRIVYA